MSDTIDLSSSYPKKHGKPEKTKHKSTENKPIEIVEELSELVKLGKAGGRYVWIIDNQVFLI
ncbi:hypothetical protein B6U67_00835 [Methanosarcinales archaeon ex4484_138]|nr:MAG: hypothetical protein B6U67_00835 [Methanosarcinales archaeon ex4484_138]